MPHYDVTVVVEFQGTVHANSQQEAEDFAYSNWEAVGGAQIQYTGVVSTDATETDADSETDNCPEDCADIEAYDAEEDDELANA